MSSLGGRLNSINHLLFELLEAPVRDVLELDADPELLLLNPNPLLFDLESAEFKFVAELELVFEAGVDEEVELELDDC